MDSMSALRTTAEPDAPCAEARAPVIIRTLSRKLGLDATRKKIATTNREARHEPATSLIPPESLNGKPGGGVIIHANTEVISAKNKTSQKIPENGIPRDTAVPRARSMFPPTASTTVFHAMRYPYLKATKPRGRRKRKPNIPPLGKKRHNTAAMRAGINSFRFIASGYKVKSVGYKGE